MLTYLFIYFSKDSLIHFQILLGILTSLSDFLSFILIPCTAFINNIAICCQIKNITSIRDSFTEHNIKLCFLKWRSNLILYNFDSCSVSDYFSALFDLFNSANIQSYGRIEFECTTACCCFRTAKHHSDLLTQLINKDNRTVGLTDDRCQFTKRLRHQTCLKSYMRITHFTIDFGFGNKCCNRIDYNNINCTGTNHGLCDFKCLFSAVRLRNIQIINIYTNVLCVYRVKCMFCINKSGNTASFLHFRNHMKRHGRFTAGFRSVYFNDSTFWNPAKPKCNIQAQRTGRNCFNTHCV